jgi:transposase
VFFKIRKNDRLALKVAIISMVNSGLAKQVDLAKAFHLHRDSISKYLKAYRQLGLASLTNQRTGPRGVPHEMEKRVIELLSATTIRTEIPKIILREFGESISRTQVYKIRKRHLSEREKEQQSQFKGEKN